MRWALAALLILGPACAAEETPNDGSHEGDTLVRPIADAPKVPDGCGAWPTKVVSRVEDVRARIETETVTCESSRSSWSCQSGRPSCSAMNDHRVTTSKPVAIKGVREVSCRGPDGTCDGTAVWSDGALLVTKETPGSLDVALDVDDATVTAPVYVSFFFSDASGCGDGGLQDAAAD